MGVLKGVDTPFGQWEYKVGSPYCKLGHLPRRDPSVVYILLCSNGKHYVGHSSQLKHRLESHINGSGAVYTKKHGVQKVLWVSTVLPRKEAATLEYWLKSIVRYTSKLSGSAQLVRE